MGKFFSKPQSDESNESNKPIKIDTNALEKYLSRLEVETGAINMTKPQLGPIEFEKVNVDKLFKFMGVLQFR